MTREQGLVFILFLLVIPALFGVIRRVGSKRRLKKVELSYNAQMLNLRTSKD